MAIEIYDNNAASVTDLAGRTVAIVGYGNQGRAHALNLRDSGVAVVIGQRPGRSLDSARADGFAPLPAGEAVRQADLVIVALPDERAAAIYQADMAAHLAAGKCLGFIHGFNIHYRFIEPPADVDVVMVAPKGPGTLLRSLYLGGKGLPALLAVGHDASGSAERLALAWSAGIGANRAAIVRTTFAAETETDLFGEQAVLCGGVTSLCQAAFDTLVEAGYEPEFAYLECVHELKQIVDLIYESGVASMRQRISNTAEYGDRTRGPRLISQQVRDEMKRILQEVRDGTFAREWIEQARSGNPLGGNDTEGDLFEEAGRNVRKLMPWLSGDSGQ
jgi:ketol-acid reductoisomerase